MTITNGYCTLAEVKLRYHGTEGDPRIEAEIEAASREVDVFCGDRFFQETAIKYFSGKGYRTLRMHPYLYTLTLVEYLSDIDGDGIETWTELESDAIESNGSSIRIRSTSANVQFPDGKHNVRVTGVWGQAEIPQAIKDATIQRTIERLNEQFDPIISERRGALSLAQRHRIEPLTGGAVG